MEPLPQTHIIRKQILDVEVGDLSQSWEWQERLSRFANGPLAKRLAEVFDTACTPSEVIRLDRLVLSANLSWRGDWEGELLEQIARQVQEQIPWSSSPVETVENPDFSTEQPGKFMEAFFHFLETGQLPWWVSSSTAASFEGELRKVLHQAQLTLHWVEQFRSVIQQPRQRQRLEGQFSEQVLAMLAVVFLGKTEMEMAETEAFVTKVFKKSASLRAAVQAGFWARIFEETTTETEAVLAKTIAAFLKTEPKQASLAKSQAPPVELAAVEEMAAKRPRQFLDWVAKAARQHPVGELFEKAAKLPSTAEIKNETVATNPPLSKGLEPDSVIFLRNAGVVLLHPFLPTLFEALKFAKQGQLVKPERAVCLLQYLATGRVGAMEHELPLNKLLCGVAQHQPLNRRIRLTKNEKTEADNLLRAVVRHWSALGNTTPDGLRGTFLCREGKLTRMEDGTWLLRVEQRSFDVLLADLPWGISTIKLPWMAEMLNVEWA